MFTLFLPHRSARTRLAALEGALERHALDELGSYAATAEGWRHHGVVIADTAESLDTSADWVVRTRHARPLSAVFYALQEILAAHLTPHNRALVFGRLADSALAWLAVHQPEPAASCGLCRAVLREARSCLIEFEADEPAVGATAARNRARARLSSISGHSRRRAPLAA